MSALRSTVAAVVGVALLGLAVAERDTPAVVPATFASLGEPTQPFLPTGTFITSSWFCPGVPARGDGVGGSVVVANTSDEPATGSLTVHVAGASDGSDGSGSPVVRPVVVEARSTLEIDLRTLVPEASFLAALVELDGGVGFVEQVARHPAGDSVSPCAPAPAASWYLADGFTVADSVMRLVVTNPFPDTAIVDVEFVTLEGRRAPGALQGYPIGGRSVAVIELPARDEPVIATTITASRGRVVVGRAQHYLGGGRLGWSTALAVPSPADQVFFVDGGEPADVEQYQIFNPTDREVLVDIRFLGLDPDTPFANDEQVAVPGGDVVTFDVAAVEGLPAGPHGVVFSTFATASMVVERVRTVGSGAEARTTVVAGSPGSFASSRWSLAIAPDEPDDDALVVLNADSVDARVQVSSLGPGGLVPVPGLADVPVAAGAVVTLPLTDPSALGTAVVVTSGQRLFVERRAGGSFALPG